MTASKSLLAHPRIRAEAERILATNDGRGALDLIQLGLMTDIATRGIESLFGEGEEPTDEDAAQPSLGLTADQLRICKETGCPPERFAELKRRFGA